MSGVLMNLASSMIAMDLINYDTTGYIKGEAPLMLNVLQNTIDNIFKDLREQDFQEVMD